jgi:hypothetical protein
MALSIDAFINAGFKVEELAPELWLIEDYLNDEDIKSILDYASTKTEEDWTGYYMEHLRDRAEKEFGTRDIEMLNREGKFEITFDWADKTIYLPRLAALEKLDEGVLKIISYDPNLEYNYSGTLQRQYKDSDLKVHVDNHVDPHIAYAAVVYLNDDYTHGEIIFPKQGLELKPKKGSMLFFSSTDTHPHGVNPPGPGPMRYVLPCFIKQINLPEGFVHSPSNIHLQYQTHKRY